MPWMSGVTRHGTENRHVGRKCGGVKGKPIFLVWHYTVRDFEWSLHALTLGEVSAHFLIDVDGTIHQLVDTDDAAWTQGVKRADERDHLLNVLGGVCKRLASSGSANENLWAIGVEIVNSGSEPYTPSQIEACMCTSPTGVAKLTASSGAGLFRSATKRSILGSPIPDAIFPGT